jgi:hypothetical protein
MHYTLGKIEFRNDDLLKEAATLLERYRDQMLYHSDCRPTSKEVNELLGKIYAASQGRANH